MFKFPMLPGKWSWPGIVLLAVALLAGCGAVGAEAPGGGDTFNPFAIEFRAIDQHREDASTNDFVAAHALAQSFRSDQANLNQIAVQLKAAPGLAAGGTFHLKAGATTSGPYLVTIPFAAADFSPNP